MRPSTNQPANQHLSALTGLRIFAALHVVIYHFGRQLLADIPKPLFNIVDAGYIGVSLFYILSGFILTYVYLDPQGERRVNPRSFWLARFARVYPVYLFGLLIWIPILIDKIYAGILTPLTTVAVVTTVPTAMQAWLPNAACEWNCPTWSVSVEAFFYFLFPFIAAKVFARIDTGSRNRALAIMGGLWILTLLPPLPYVIAERSGTLESGAQTWLDFLKFNPLVRLPEFLLGIVLGKFFLTNASRNTLGEKWSPALSLVALAGITIVLAFSPRLPYVLLHNGLIAPLFALLIYTLAVGRGPLVSFLSLAPIVFLGEASYALYILHAPIWDWLHRIKVQFDLQINDAESVGYFLTYLAILFIASIVIFKWIEIPARDVIRRAVTRQPAGELGTRRGIALSQPALSILAAVVLVGLTSGLYALVRPAAAAHVDTVAIDPDIQVNAVVDPRGNLLSAERLARGLEASGWLVMSGEWSFENGALVQRQADAFDRNIVFSENFSNYVYQVRLRHLEGSGGGLLFNLPQQELRNSGHLVRYNDEGTGVFWGYYDENGDFFGQGYASTLPVEKKAERVLEVQAGSDTYTVRSDGRTLAENVPLFTKEGKVGLHTSTSVVAFDSAEVLTSDGSPSAAAPRAGGGSAIATAPALTEGDLLSSLAQNPDLVAAGWTPISGQWAFQDGVLTQSQREGFDRNISYEGTYSDYTLSVALRHLEGSGGGVLFNMPQPDTKNGSHLVRFSEDGKAVFWGYYDQNGDFTGQGSADVEAPGTDAHSIEVRVGAENYTVLVDGQVIVENVPLQSQEGHIGLTSSESVVAFESVQVTR